MLILITLYWSCQKVARRIEVIFFFFHWRSEKLDLLDALRSERSSALLTCLKYVAFNIARMCAYNQMCCLGQVLCFLGEWIRLSMPARRLKTNMLCDENRKREAWLVCYCEYFTQAMCASL